MPLHLVVAISAHGYGHATQTAPVLKAVRRHIPNIKITLRTALPNDYLVRRFEVPFQHDPVATDFGMAMESALSVDVETSARRYRALHENWQERLNAEQNALTALSPDLVLANIPYLTLAAAQRARIPTIAMCSLNWADIFGHYCQHTPGANTIVETMRQAYAEAALFLQLSPHMPMDYLPNRRHIGPVAVLGNNRRDEINQKLKLSPNQQLVPIAFGGIATRLPVDNWPISSNVHYLVPAAWQAKRKDMSPVENLDVPFIDVLCSSDAVIAKPGYGTFAEAACNRIPLLCAPRGDWPETPYLMAWLSSHGRVVAIKEETLEKGDFTSALDTLLLQSVTLAPEPTGANEAAKYVSSMLTP